MIQTLIHFCIPRYQNTEDSKVRERYGILSGIVGIVCNILLFVLKLIIGLITGAISVSADAFNNLSDCLSSLISIIGFKLSDKAPDEKHPFGYGRTEYVCGLVVALIILLVGFEFLKTSVVRIFRPETVSFSWILFGLLLASLLVKLWLSVFNQTLGKAIDSPVLLAAGQDSRNDVITTAVVLIGMIAGRYTTIAIDGYVGVFVAVFILISGFSIAKETLAPLLGEAADPDIVKKLKASVLASDGIVGVHDLIVHNYGVGRSLASIHAEVPSDSDFVVIHEIIDETEKRVYDETGVYLVIHMDPIDIRNEHVNKIRGLLQCLLREIDAELSMHDFRMVDGERNINLLFDIIVPFRYSKNDISNLQDTIRTRLQAIDERYRPIITIDHQM